MSFEWMFPETVPQNLSTVPNDIGPVFLSDTFQLEWTPTNLSAFIVFGCNEAGKFNFINRRSFDKSPGLWHLTEHPQSSESESDCQFAYDYTNASKPESKGFMKGFQYIDALNQRGASTWSASSSTTKTKTAKSTSLPSTTMTTDVIPNPTTAQENTIVPHDNTAHKDPGDIALGVGVGISVAVIVGLIVTFLLFLRRRRRRRAAGLFGGREPEGFGRDEPTELDSERRIELDSPAAEMEGQDKRRPGMVELG